jgi:hypothetical protein
VRAVDHEAIWPRDRRPAPALTPLPGSWAPAREHLRTALIRDQADRDAITSRLMRYRDENGQRWADIIDFLTNPPEARRRLCGSSRSRC